MKQIHRYARNVVASAVALLAIAFATHATAQTPVVANPTSPEVTAKVVNMKGKARVSTDGKSWQPVAKGDVIKPGSVIQTAGSDSFVDIVLGTKEGTGAAGAQPVAFNPSSAGGGENPLIRM